MKHDQGGTSLKTNNHISSKTAQLGQFDNVEYED